MSYDLPTSIWVGDNEFEIWKKGDYRAIIPVLSVFHDPDLGINEIMGDEHTLVTLALFFDLDSPEEVEKIFGSNIKEAYDNMCTFIDCGAVESNPLKVRLYDWDVHKIPLVGAISAIAGFPILEIPYMHWYSFMSYFNQMGEGMFHTICSINWKLHKRIKLEKWEREFEQQHPDLIHFNNPHFKDEQELINSILNS